MRSSLGKGQANVLGTSSRCTRTSRAKVASSRQKWPALNKRPAHITRGQLPAKAQLPGQDQLSSLKLNETSPHDQGSKFKSEVDKLKIEVDKFKSEAANSSPRGRKFKSARPQIQVRDCKFEAEADKYKSKATNSSPRPQI